MYEQLPLEGFAAPQSRGAVFFTIYPDRAAAAQITRLTQRLQGLHALSGRPIGMTQFHVTLCHVGEYEVPPQGILAAAEKAASAVAMPVFDVAFDCAARFGKGDGRRPLVLCGADGVAGLIAFRHALGVAMTNAGIGRWVKRPFEPHVTLLYDDGVPAETHVVPVRWTVRELVLVHSLYGRRTHVRLGRWPLRR
jgi:RNA 2',3'-cyclic 3'-phosphodiesterase